MMNAEPDLTRISFRGVGLLEVVHTGSVVALVLEDALINRLPKAAEVTVGEASALLQNELPVSDLRTKEDGEVFTSRGENGKVPFATQWDDLTAKIHEIVAYTPDGPTVTLRVGPVA